MPVSRFFFFLLHRFLSPVLHMKVVQETGCRHLPPANNYCTTEVRQVEVSPRLESCSAALLLSSSSPPHSAINPNPCFFFLPSSHKNTEPPTVYGSSFFIYLFLHVWMEEMADLVTVLRKKNKYTTLFCSPQIITLQIIFSFQLASYFFICSHPSVSPAAEPRRGAKNKNCSIQGGDMME